MSIIANKIIYDDIFLSQYNHIIDKMLYQYKDEFVAQGFVDEYEKVYKRLRYVNESEGRLLNSKLHRMGYRRVLIKKYKYVIIYKYHDRIVELRYIFPSRMNYLRLIK